MNRTQPQTLVCADGAVERDGDHEVATDVDADVRRHLADCRFAFFLNQVTWDFEDGVLTLEGRVGTDHLKRALDSLLRDIQCVTQVINRVDVVSATGVSRIQAR